MDALQFTINFIDGVSGPARSAADSLGVLERAFKSAGAASEKIKGMSLGGGGNAKVDAVNAQTSGKSKLQAEKSVQDVIGQSQKNQAKLLQIEAKKNAALEVEAARHANKMEALEKRDAGKNARVDRLAGIFGAEGALGGIQEQLMGIAQSGPLASTGFGQFVTTAVEAAGPLGLVIAAAAAFAAVTVGLTYTLGKFALGQADAKRSLLLSLEGFTGSAKAAGEMNDAIEIVSRQTPAAGAQIEQLARKLAGAKLSGDLFSQTLKSLATVASVVGPEAADKLQTIIDKSAVVGHFEIPEKALMGTGVAVADLVAELAKQMGKTPAIIEAALKAGKISTQDGVKALNAVIANGNLGKVLERQMLSFEVQMAKVHENLGNLFDESAIEPFLKGLQLVTELFSQNTATGQALKVIFEGIYSGLFGAASRVFPYIKAFMQGIVIVALQLYIAIKPIAKAIASLFGGGADKTLLGMFTALGKVIAVVLVVVVALIGMFAGALAVISAPFVMAWGAILQLISLFDQLGDKLTNTFWKTDLTGAGSRLVDGFVNGIKGGVGRAVDAAANMARSAVAAVQNALDMHSPSRVMMKLGGYTAQGFAEGVDSGAPNAEAALSSMVNPSAPTAAPAGGRSAGAMTFAPVIQIDGNADRAAIEELILPKLVNAFEQLRIQVGAMPAMGAQ